MINGNRSVAFCESVKDQVLDYNGGEPYSIFIFRLLEDL